MTDRDCEIQLMVGDLSGRFPVLPRVTVERLVGRLLAEFEDAPIQTYVPVLVLRAAERALRQVNGLPTDRSVSAPYPRRSF